MTRMTQAEITSFLQTPNMHAIIGTNSVNGPPQLSPVWYIYEAGKLYSSIISNSVKHRNLKRDPLISVCIDGGRGDTRTVILYGRAQLFGPEDVLNKSMLWQIVLAYHETEEQAQRYYETVRDDGLVLIVLEPEKIVSQDFRE